MQKGKFFWLTSEDDYCRNVDDSFSKKARMISSAELVPEGVLRFKKTRGRKNSDLFYNDPHLLVASEKFVSILREIDAKGWHAYPSKMIDKGKEMEGKYFALSISGRSGVLNPTNSRFVEKGYDNSSVEVGLELDTDAWDGSDLFIPNKRRHVICTFRVKEALEAAEVHRVRFEDLYDMNVTEMAKEAYAESLR